MWFQRQGPVVDVNCSTTPPKEVTCQAERDRTARDIRILTPLSFSSHSLSEEIMGSQPEGASRVHCMQTLAATHAVQSREVIFCLDSGPHLRYSAWRLQSSCAWNAVQPRSWSRRPKDPSHLHMENLVALENSPAKDFP